MLTRDIYSEPRDFMEDYLSQLSQLQGETNYGSAENLVRQQMQQAQARRPSRTG